MTREVRQMSLLAQRLVWITEHPEQLYEMEFRSDLITCDDHDIFADGLVPVLNYLDCLLLLRCHVDKGHRPAGDVGHIAAPLLNCLPLHQGWRHRSVE